MLHWTVLSLLLATMAAALWRRFAAPLQERLRLLARPNMMACALAAAFAVTGGWIFYNTNVAHAYVTTNEMSDWQADYEKAYKAHRGDAASADPRGRRRGRSLPRRAALSRGGTLCAGQRIHAADRERLRGDAPGGAAGRLVHPVGAAGRERRSIRHAPLRLRSRRWLRALARSSASISPSTAGGFASGQQDDAVVENGTFLMNFRGFPTLGYRGSYELSDLRERRKRGLERREHRHPGRGRRAGRGRCFRGRVDRSSI